MNISPISTNNNATNFNALKYQNGLRTKSGLSPELKKLLEKSDSDIQKMKNIDIMVFDSNNLKLCIKTPRFMSEIYERFFKEKRYNEVKNDEQNSFVMVKGSSINKLVPSEVPGIYDVVYRYPGNEEWEKSYPVRTLEVAKSLDAIMQNIETCEDKYGMNCTKVLDNIENIRKEQEHLNIINQIKSVYKTNNEFKNMSKIDLGILLENKEAVEKIKNYEIVMDEVNFPYPVLIHDKNSYLDDIFNDYYQKHGWVFERYSNGFTMYPSGREYPNYSLVDKGENKYNVYVDFYEGGSNLGSFGNEHFKSLVRLMQILDDVAKSISERQ